MTDLELVQRLAGGEMSVAEVLEHLARTERPKLTRPPVRTLEQIESEPDRLPMSESVSALYGARYGGTISEDEFWAVYEAMWPDVGASS